MLLVLFGTCVSLEYLLLRCIGVCCIRVICMMHLAKRRTMTCNNFNVLSSDWWIAVHVHHIYQIDSINFWWVTLEPFTNAKHMLHLELFTLSFCLTRTNKIKYWTDANFISWVRFVSYAVKKSCDSQREK